MFGFFKSKHRRTVERVSNELHAGVLKIYEAMNFQLDMLMFFEGKQKQDFLIDPYFVRYAFGMLDAVTTILGLHLRQKLGRGLIERWFVPYITVELGLDEATARQLLEKLFELYHKQDPRDAARWTAVLMALRDCKTVTRVAYYITTAGQMTLQFRRRRRKRFGRFMNVIVFHRPENDSVMITNVDVYLAVAEEALAESERLENLARRPKPDGEPGIIITYDQERRSFKNSLVAIVFAGMFLEACFYLAGVKRFGVVEYNKKHDGKKYEDKLPLFGLYCWQKPNASGERE